MVSVDDSPRLFYCQLCGWQFWMRPGWGPHQCVAPAEDTVERVADNGNPPSPTFSTAAENQRWLERLRKRVGNG